MRTVDQTPTRGKKDQFNIYGLSNATSDECVRIYGSYHRFLFVVFLQLQVQDLIFAGPGRSQTSTGRSSTSIIICYTTL